MTVTTKRRKLVRQSRGEFLDLSLQRHYFVVPLDDSLVQLRD